MGICLSAQVAAQEPIVNMDSEPHYSRVFSNEYCRAYIVSFGCLERDELDRHGCPDGCDYRSEFVAPEGRRIKGTAALQGQCTVVSRCSTFTQESGQGTGPLRSFGNEMNSASVGV